MPYISFIVAFIASECIKGFFLKAYGAALCILSFTACLLEPQRILNFKGRFAFVSKSIPLVICKVLWIPNFYQILIHLLVGELSHGEVSDP